MSVELPEAFILSEQMSKEIVGKVLASCELQNTLKFQNLGFINIYSSDFNRLCGGKITSVVSRGNVIRVKLDNGANLLLAPEYGGVILFHQDSSSVPCKFNLKVSFKDSSTLTVTLTGMGIIKALTDEELKDCYVYKRDFSATASPLDADFSFRRFANDLASTNVNIKTVLVGKDAIVVGLGNSAFQDIIYRAKIHPKRKASNLNEKEKQALYNAVKQLIEQRIKLGGKNQFIDLYGKRGTYSPAMGPNMKDRPCVVCGTVVEKLSLGGGQVYCCPNCQK